MDANAKRRSDVACATATVLPVSRQYSSFPWHKTRSGTTTAIATYRVRRPRIAHVRISLRPYQSVLFRRTIYEPLADKDQWTRDAQPHRRCHELGSNRRQLETGQGQ